MSTLTAGRQKTVEDQILEIYLAYRRQVHPDWTPSVKKAALWARIARTVQNLQADPRLFIEAQFELGRAQRGESAMYPESIAGAKAVETYEEYRRDFRSIVERSVEEMMRRLAAAVTRGGLTTDQAAIHPEVKLSPWFRLLACSEDALPQVKVAYLGAALVELRRDPGLAEYLKSQFHDRYKSRIYQALSGPVGYAHSQMPPPPEPDYPGARFRTGVRLSGS